MDRTITQIPQNYANLRNANLRNANLRNLNGVFSEIIATFVRELLFEREQAYGYHTIFL